MSCNNGPSIVTNGLILALNPFSPKNTTLSSTNFLSNGAFADGLKVTQESGSNPTNEIIKLANPGDSDYVLRQTGVYTEYQMNLSTQLLANTTYVMSGWYAKSLDYNGSAGDIMFHARAHSASGANNATGTGIGTTLFTTNVNGIEWKYCYQTITTPADYNNVFEWYLGYGQPTTHAGYRYYTNLKVEKGTFPSLVDFSGNNNHHYYAGAVNYANEKFTLDGSTSGFIRESSLNNVSSDCTVVIWYSTTDTQELWIMGSNSTSNYLSASASNNYYHSNCGTPTNYVDLNTVVRPDSPVNYRNGNYHMWEAKGVNLSGWTRYDWFLYPGGWQLAGNVSAILVYNRSLSASESKQNFNALRSRYGI